MADGGPPFHLAKIIKLTDEPNKFVFLIIPFPKSSALLLNLKLISGGFNVAVTAITTPRKGN